MYVNKYNYKFSVNTVRKMNSTLRHIELIPKMQTEIASKFKLKELRLEARKFKLCL